MLFEKSVSDQDDDARIGAVLAFRERKLVPGVTCAWREAVIIGEDSPRFDDATLAWLRKQKPDAIVAFHWPMVYGLMAAGYQFPGPIGLSSVLATPRRFPNTPLVSGCDRDMQQ